MSGCKKICVYGSLMKGFFNYKKALEGMVITCTPAKMRGKLFHQLEKGYPALVDGSDWVHGELLELKDFPQLLVTMDELEGYYGPGGKTNEYERLMSEVFVQNSDRWETERAYIYWYARPDLGTKDNPAVYLPEGDWRTYMHS
ncbi:MAG: gamma-glutamylcyclotransferase family protein [Sphaerochaetaceae bacterium]